MISWVIRYSTSKNSPVFKAFIIESVTEINNQISWKPFFFGWWFSTWNRRWGALPVSAGGDLWVCSSWLPDLYAYENHHYWCPEYFYHDIRPWDFAGGARFCRGQRGWAGGFGGNVEARRYKYPRGVFVGFASNPPDSFSLSSLFNRATIIDTNWAWVFVIALRKVA